MLNREGLTKHMKDCYNFPGDNAYAIIMLDGILNYAYRLQDDITCREFLNTALHNIIPEEDIARFISTPINTHITYMYRDASNYKMFTDVVVSGELNNQQIEQILANCDMGTFFIPSQVGLPENRFSDYTEDDHCWFEFDRDSFEQTTALPTEMMSAQDLYQAFLDTGGKWNDDFIPFC